MVPEADRAVAVIVLAFSADPAGSTLLRHGLVQCDRDHVAAYLESTNPANIPLYRRHGFEVLTTIQLGSSPPIFPMLRPAR
jgi:hypothetical protein